MSLLSYKDDVKKLEKHFDQILKEIEFDIEAIKAK